MESSSLPSSWARSRTQARDSARGCLLPVRGQLLQATPNQVDLEAEYAAQFFRWRLALQRWRARVASLL